MRVIFKSSFARDLKKIRSKSLRQQIQNTIQQIEQASSTQDMPNLKKLTGDGPYYRIRMGDYRFGLIIDQETITFVRFLHRRDIYRYFP